MLEAEDRLKDPGSIPDRDLDVVVLRATGDPDLAELTLRRRVAARLERGEKPDI